MSLETSLIPKNEDQLIALIGKGDQQAFQQYFNLLELPLLFFAGKLTNNLQQAEDTVLTAFQKFWEQRQGFLSQKAARSFLYTTVRNHALNYIKRQNMIGVAHREIRNSLPEQEEYIECRMQQSELLGKVYTQIKQLPEKYRQILEWTYFEELTTAAIANKLSMEESSVRAAKTRAIVLLRKTFSETDFLILSVLFFDFMFRSRGIS